MKSRTDMSNVKNVFSAYNRMNEKGLFKTPIGYNYLYSLRTIIMDSGQYGEDEVDDIKVFSGTGSKTKVKTVYKDADSVFKNHFINMIIVNVVLVLILVIFVIISNNSENINIINYKNRIDEQYKAQEENLAQWSRELELKEKSLEELEISIDGE